MHTLKLLRTSVFAVAACLTIAASGAGYSQQQPAAEPVAVQPVSFAPPPPLPQGPELMRLRDGFAAERSGDWYGVKALRDSATDPLVRRMLQWRYAASSQAPLEFHELADALRELQGWPGRGAMRQRAEQAIFTSRLTPAERIAFLQSDGGPATGDGRIALAQALRAAGRRAEAEEAARAAWRADSLGDAAVAAALAEFSSAFTQDDFAARVDVLLWRGERSGAQRYFSRIAPADRLLAEARIALQVRQRRGLQAAVDAVPASRRDNPGLLYDRARYIRRSGRPEDAMPVAAQIDARQAPPIARDDIFQEKRLYIPRALRAGSHRLAYTLVTNHGLSGGESFADAEWLSGWLCLRFLDRPRDAAEHFSHLSENVSAPVSLSRAFYWRGEAARALGDSAAAAGFYDQAAGYNFTYYGQLAAGKRGGPRPVLSLPETHAVSAEARARFDNRELVRALRLMSQIGDQRDFESIAYFLDDTLDDAQEIELLSQLAREQSYARTALRNGKAGLFRGVVATEASYPLLRLPGAVTRPEPALVLAIIRQESEFDPQAISSANARGLMQLIPSTAQLQARREGLAFDRARLTSDPDYNMTLGAAHLGDLVDDFGGSYVLAIAAYNAGSSRSREWIADWGDPRSGGVDVVDWVELIPFSETRNYVQRVMENLQVYRHRLAGTPTPITLDQDLRRGRN